MAISVPCFPGQTSPPSPPSRATRSTTFASVSGFRSTPVSTRHTAAAPAGGGSMYGRNSACAIWAAGEGVGVSARATSAPAHPTASKVLRSVAPRHDLARARRFDMRTAAAFATAASRTEPRIADLPDDLHLHGLGGVALDIR